MFDWNAEDVATGAPIVDMHGTGNIEKNPNRFKKKSPYEYFIEGFWYI